MHFEFTFLCFCATSPRRHIKCLVFSRFKSMRTHHSYRFSRRINSFSRVLSLCLCVVMLPSSYVVLFPSPFLHYLPLKLHRSLALYFSFVYLMPSLIFPLLHFPGPPVTSSFHLLLFCHFTSYDIKSSVISLAALVLSLFLSRRAGR